MQSDSKILLELPSVNRYSNSMYIPLIHISNKTYLLESKKEIQNLYRSLTIWLDENNLTSEYRYEKMIPKVLSLGPYGIHLNHE